MGGFFGTVSKASCVTDLFYGTDYNSHLGTKRGGLATYDAEEGMFARSIHNLESTYFRTKFEDELDKFKGNVGIGIISDTDPQPIIINSHLGRFANCESGRNRSRATFPKYALRRTEFRQYQSNRAYLTTHHTRKNFCRRYRKCLPPCQRLLLYAAVIRRWQYHCGS